jgi:hypothetical protein
VDRAASVSIQNYTSFSVKLSVGSSSADLLTPGLRDPPLKLLPDTTVDLIALAVKVGHSAKLLGELDQSGVNVAGLGTAWCDQMSGHFVREIYGLGLDVEVEPW